MTMKYVGVPRECGRCGAEVHMSAEHQPHLCADIVRRLARREKQVQAVMALLLRDPNVRTDEDPRPLAEAIVKKLSGMGVTED